MSLLEARNSQGKLVYINEAIDLEAAKHLGQIISNRLRVEGDMVLSQLSGEQIDRWSGVQGTVMTAVLGRLPRQELQGSVIGLQLWKCTLDEAQRTMGEMASGKLFAGTFIYDINGGYGLLYWTKDVEKVLDSQDWMMVVDSALTK